MHALAVGRLVNRMEEVGAGRSLAKKEREEKRILDVMVGFQLTGCLTGWNKQVQGQRGGRHGRREN